MTDKPLEWIGRSKEDLMDFPDDARRKAGFELRSIQQGDVASDVKPMSTIGKGVESRFLCRQIWGSNLCPTCIPKEDPKDISRRHWARTTTISANDSTTDTNTMTQSNVNIFEELGFLPEEAENLRIRSDLMISLRKLIRSRQWSLQTASENLKTTIDCVESLMAGDIDRFQVEQLITMLTHGGMKVQVEIVAAA
jgi:predicted XRE-type DNA-binding protein